MIRISDVRRVSGGRGVVKKAPGVAHAPQKQTDTSKGPAVARVAKALTDVLEAAAAVRAATVHIEPHDKEVVVRYRVDGALRAGKTVPVQILSDLTSHVKQLANLDTQEDRVPQDGRFDTTLGGTKYVVRASFLPTADGEKIVLHLSNQTSEVHDLERLGYWGQALTALTQALDTERGLVVVTGPTGSGKTATMYGLLHMLADPSRTIATVEDTVEHRVPGISQTEVNSKAGMTFDETLRAALHQDPNVVMVSELREPATAQVAVHAAVAGRLIIAGMHFRNVAAALSHLSAMDIEPYLLASAVHAVANQRLVRRLCQECRESYQPTPEEFTAACHASGLSPHGVIGHLARLEQEAAAAFKVEPTGTIENGAITRMWRAKPGGCEACGHTGYKGRIALCEVILISPAIQKLIFASNPAIALYNQAITEGLVPLPIDGFVKSMLGFTSLEEVLHAVSV